MKSRQNSEPESTIDYVAEAGVARIALNRPARLNASFHSLCANCWTRSNRRIATAYGSSCSAGGAARFARVTT